MTPDENNIDKPAEVFPVGYYLREEMVERGWSVYELANWMGDSSFKNILAIRLILDVNAPGAMLGQKAADGLAKAFGTSAEFWMNLDAAWQKRNQ